MEFSGHVDERKRREPPLQLYRNHRGGSPSVVSSKAWHCNDSHS
jgi:hypothetical protein